MQMHYRKRAVHHCFLLLLQITISSFFIQLNSEIRMKYLVTILLLMSAGFAGECTLQPGKLVKITRTSEPVEFISPEPPVLALPGSEVVAHVSVELKDVVYGIRMQDKRASQFNAGEPVQACVEGSTFHLRSPEGKTYRARIETRERIATAANGTVAAGSTPAE